MIDRKKELENRSKPFSKERTKMIVCRVIYFYSLFYVIMKIIAMFKGYDFISNLMVTLPLVILAVIGFRMEKLKRYSWLYVIVGIIVISTLRYYELDLLRYFGDL